MSFELRAEVVELTKAQAAVLEAQVAKRGAWPVYPDHQRHRFRADGPLRLSIPEAIAERHLLHDDAGWGMPHWRFAADVADELARTIEILGEVLEQGFTFMATWTGSSALLELTLPANWLVRLVRLGRVNEFTRYRVQARGPAAPRGPTRGGASESTNPAR